MQNSSRENAKNTPEQHDDDDDNHEHRHDKDHDQNLAHHEP